MNKLYDYITEKNFKYLTILIPFSLDMRIVYDAYKQLGTREYFDQSIGLILAEYQKASPEVGNMIMDMGPEYIDSVWQLVHKATLIGAILFLSIHISIYMLVHLGKKSGISYIKFYAISSGVLLIFFNLSKVFTVQGLSYIAHGFLMLSLYQGIKYFKKQGE